MSAVQLGRWIDARVESLANGIRCQKDAGDGNNRQTVAHLAATSTSPVLIERLSK